MSGHSGDDEYYSDYEYEGSEEWFYDNSETSYSAELVKAENGHLTVHEVWLTRYPGEDWGEASGCREQVFRIKELEPEYVKHAIAVGRGLKPGESTPFYGWLMEEEETE